MGQPVLYLRFDVPLPVGVWVRAWAPTSEEDGIQCMLGEGLCATLWVPTDLLVNELVGHLEGKGATSFGSIRVLIEVYQLPAGVRAAFEAYDWRVEPCGELADFLTDVHDQVLRATNRLLSYIRNQLGQWEVALLNAPDQYRFFADCAARWSWDGGSWCELRGGRKGRIGARIVRWGDAEVRREHWSSIKAFLQSPDEPDTTKVLLANARDLASRGDLRGATIEAAISLERELSLLVGRFLRERGLREKGIVGKEGSATTLLRTWLPLIRPSTPADHREAAGEVLSKRNEILHQAHINVGAATAKHIWTTTLLVEALRTERLAHTPFEVCGDQEPAHMEQRES